MSNDRARGDQETSHLQLCVCASRRCGRVNDNSSFPSAPWSFGSETPVTRSSRSDETERENVNNGPSTTKLLIRMDRIQTVSRGHMWTRFFLLPPKMFITFYLLPFFFQFPPFFYIRALALVNPAAAERERIHSVSGRKTANAQKGGGKPVVGSHRRHGLAWLIVVHMHCQRGMRTFLVIKHHTVSTVAVGCRPGGGNPRTGKR